MYVVADDVTNFEHDASTHNDDVTEFVAEHELSAVDDDVVVSLDVVAVVAVFDVFVVVTCRLTFLDRNSNKGESIYFFKLS